MYKITHQQLSKLKNILFLIFVIEKNGISTDKAIDLYKHIIENCKHLEVIGLMTIGQYGYDCTQGPNPDFLVLVNGIKFKVKNLLMSNFLGSN